MTDLPHIGLRDIEMKGHGKGRYAGVEQHTFLTPEARRLLIEYLRYRQRRGEVLTPESALFVAKLKTNGEYPPIGEQIVIRVFKSASERSGIKYTPHDMRRFGQTQLEAARLPKNWISVIMGHKLRGEESPYSRPNVEKLREGYREALPHLIFIDRVAPITEEERRKQMLRDSLRIQLKDNPKELARLENVLAKAKTAKEIDEVVKEATK